LSTKSKFIQFKTGFFSLRFIDVGIFSRGENQFKKAIEAKAFYTTLVRKKKRGIYPEMVISNHVLPLNLAKT